jgi:hypothetical protein
MKTLSKALAGTVAAGAMVLASATPAVARDHDDGIDAGDVIAGAVIIGGIAAILSSGNNNRDRYDYRDGRYHDGDTYNGGYNRYGNPRNAVERCIAAVENDARRAGYRSADVTEIRDVDRAGRGFEVKGRLVVDGSRGWGNYNRQYNRYDRYDRYGNYDRGYDRDSGRFTCDFERGRVVDLDYSGIRGLR